MNVQRSLFEAMPAPVAVRHRIQFPTGYLLAIGRQMPVAAIDNLIARIPAVLRRTSPKLIDDTP